NIFLYERKFYMKTSTKYILCGVLCALFTGAVEGQEVTYKNAPKVSPRTTEEMQHPGFWISNIKGDPDRVIMTPEQIVELNIKNRTKSYDMKDVNGKPYSIKNTNTILVENPLSIKTFSGDSLRVLLLRNRNFLEARPFYDFRKKEYDEDMKNDLYENTDPASIPDLIVPQHGILVTHSNNRRFPTHKIAFDERDGWINQFSTTSLDAAMPVAILHTSRDRDWYFVRSEIAFGWVPAVNVAIGSAEEIRAYVNAENFIMSCTYKVPVYGDSEMKNFLMDLYMGARIKLINETPNSYHVLVPFRRSDGSFETVMGWVKPDALVSVGYQPFTQRNIINTFFTVLYRPWSGGDSYNERNCCGGIRAVLRTFGIFTLNSTTFQLHASDHVIAFPKETQKEIKYKYLEGCDPGICLIGSSEHVIMYLGEVNGRQYVIHQTGYTYTEDDGTVMLVRRVNVNDTELEGGSHVDTWTYICTLKP
ncbi:MAG TPA: SH3 domain-containing protein, partial [Anaerolineae bacterium]|nr:SH3 domain-containing protein [Anaerolineae bacterium]